MKQITIRKVADSTISLARRQAQIKGVAMNTIFVEALNQGLGVKDGAATNGLEQFCADSDFGDEWDQRMAELDKVNPEDWK